MQKIFHVVAIPESGLLKAYDYTDAKEKACTFLSGCYGTDFNILDIVDCTNRKITDADYIKNRLG
jgi:hypothetical protein